MKKFIYLIEAINLIESQQRVPGSNLIFCKENGEANTQAHSDFTHIRRRALRSLKEMARR